MTRAAAGAVPAMVIDVGWVNGLSAIRSLGRAGIPVIAADHRRGALGFRSRYARPLLVPEAATDENAFVAAVAEAADEVGRPVPAFPTHDPPLNALARHLDDLPVLAPFPPWSVLADVQSKRLQLERAAEAGVATPASRFPDSAAAARAAAEELGFPVLVKPSDPIEFKRTFRRQAFRCDSPTEAEAAYAKAEPFTPIVQELVPGGDDALYTVGSYIARNGRRLGVFCGRKLRQTPPVVGTCRIGEAVWVEEVVDAAFRLLGAFDYYGLSQVEFKRDARDGSYKLMEINPRLWQWHGLATASGVDLPRIAYADLVGDDPPPATMNGRKRWAITLMAGEPPVVPRLPYVEAVLAVDDPAPAVVHLSRVVRAARR